MATTLKQLIEAAYSRSTFNDPDKLATDKELAGVIDRRFKEVYSIAAGINPYYFGTTADVVGVAGVWDRPTAAELVAHIEKTDGTEVAVVPFEDKGAELPPAVYSFGRKYYRTADSSATLTATDTLRFFYSKRPATMSAATDQLDAEWPEQFNDLIVLHVARYLAVKDQRVEEVQLFESELQSLLQSFQRHLMHENYAMVARYGHRARLVSQGPITFREG